MKEKTTIRNTYATEKHHTKWHQHSNGTNTRIPTFDVTYRGVPLPEQAPHEPIRYSGMLVTLTHDYRSEKDRVRQATQERVEVLDRANFLSPSQREAVVQLAIVSVFRYTAGLVPWRMSELEELTAMWVRGHRGAWGLPRTTPFSGSAEGKVVGAALRR